MAQPTAQEQELLELLNRMRLNPSKELDYLLNSNNKDIQDALTFFKVDTNLLKQQWSQLAPVAAVAWNDALSNAATTHNQAMIAADSQSHQLPGEAGLGERTSAAGYNFSSIRENVYAFANSIFYSHAGFAIDWGAGPGGIQDPAGHRVTMMSDGVREVGMSVIAENNPSTSVGPLVVTQEFGNRRDIDNQAYVLGVAFDDINKDGFYQAGEGVKDVQVKLTGINGTSYNKTINVFDAGGYQDLVGAGDYQVDFLRNNRVIGTKTAKVNAGSAAQNVKLDLIVPVVSLTDPSSGGNLPAATTTPVASTPVTTTPDPVVATTPVTTTPVTTTPDPVVATTPVVSNPVTTTPDPVVATTPVTTTPDPVVATTPVVSNPVTTNPDPVVATTSTNTNTQTSNLNSANNSVFGSSRQKGLTETNLLDFLNDRSDDKFNVKTDKVKAKIVNLTSQADYKNHVGLYAVLDEKGTVADLDGKTYQPGDAKYAEAALRRSQIAEEGVSFDRRGLTDEVTLQSGKIFAPFIVANGDINDVFTGKVNIGDVYFNYKAANSDRIDHIKSLGANVFGFEDTRGGGDLDYNDMIFKVDAKVLKSVPSLVGAVSA
jgi:uncharacterized protein YkwD